MSAMYTQAENGRESELAALGHADIPCQTHFIQYNAVVWDRHDASVSHHLGKPVTLPFFIQLEDLLLSWSLHL